MKLNDFQNFIKDINAKLKQDENFINFFKSIGKDGLFDEQITYKKDNEYFATITNGCNKMLQFKIVYRIYSNELVCGITFDMYYLNGKNMIGGDPTEKQNSVLPYVKSFFKIYKEDVFIFLEGLINTEKKKDEYQNAYVKLNDLVKNIENNDDSGRKKNGIPYTFNNNYAGIYYYNSNPYEYNKLVNEIVYNITGALLGIYKTIYYNK